MLQGFVFGVGVQHPHIGVSANGGYPKLWPSWRKSYDKSIHPFVVRQSRMQPHAWWAQNLLDDLGSAQNLGSDVLGASIGPSPATDVELSRCPGDSPNRWADQESAGALAGEDDCCWIILLILVRFTQGIFGNDPAIITFVMSSSQQPPATHPATNSPCIDGRDHGLHDIAPGGWVLQETRAGFSRGWEAGRGWLCLWWKIRIPIRPYPLFSPNFWLKHGETQ